MADFSALKTSIQNYIKENGNEEITGNLLQQILLSMVSTLGDSAINDLVTALNAEIANRGNADTELGGNITTLQGVVNGILANVENGYVYAGIATPSTTPVSGKVFYLALTAGTYTNFGSIVVPQGINILKYNGSAWSLDSFLGLDDAPTQGSDHLVKSGGVLGSIIQNGSAFDLSAYNAQGGVLATYADLSAALTAINALPADFKKGGMSVKFVQTSDNKYVQYMYLGTEVTGTPNPFLDTNNWQLCVLEDDVRKEIKYHSFNYLKFAGEALDGCYFNDESGYRKLIIPAGVTGTSSYISYILDNDFINSESTYCISVAVKRSKNAPKKDNLALTTVGTAEKNSKYIKTVEKTDYCIDYYYAEISNIHATFQYIGIQMFYNTTGNDWWYAVDLVVKSDLGVYVNDYITTSEKIEELQNELSPIQDLIDLEKKSIIAYDGSYPVQEYIRDKYVVYNSPFEKNCKLLALSLCAFSPYITDDATFFIYIGTLLQAHDTEEEGEWFLNTRQYPIRLSQVTYTNIDHVITITDFGDYKININKGECIGFLSQGDGHEPCFGFQYSTEPSDDKVYICNTLEGTFVKANYNIRKLTFEVQENNLVSQGQIENLNNRIDLINEEISQVDILTDRTTSQKYRIVVDNGVIGLKSLNYVKAAIIGSSCVVHPYDANIGYYRVGNGSMVPSISEYTWENFTLKALKQKNNQATISKATCAPWEVSLYDVVRDANDNIIGYTERISDYSFLSIISNDTDLVIMQLMGNTPTTYDSDETKEMLIQLLTNKAIELFEHVHAISPITDIYITEVGRNSEKVEALQRAANELSYVHYVHVNGWIESGFFWAMGDYYAEDNDALGTLYPITHSGVAVHGNDYFFYNATKLMMKAAGYNFSYPLYTITLNQVAGGAISTPNTTWFENSVVNIRCAADNGKSISSIVVKNENGTDVSSVLGLTQRINDYGTWYTFKMPAYNVTVMPTWV